MRAVVEPTATRANAAQLATLLSFDREQRKRHIPSEGAIRVPRQARINWLAAFVWLVLVPAIDFAAGWALWSVL